MHSKHFKDENMWVHHCINCGDILYFFIWLHSEDSQHTQKNQTLSSQDISCAGWLAIISCWWSL